jgi:hypothetical protein
MIKHIAQDLVLIQLPRNAEIGEYDWFDIEHDGVQIGKSRCRIESERFTIFSIMIYPEFIKHGFARAVIDNFKSRYPLILADRVRYNARDFWSKLGFIEEGTDLFVWHSRGP